MSKSLLALAVLLFSFVVTATDAQAQGAVKTGPDPTVLRDAELEKDSLHNLEVARNYFKLKKAYVAALNRTQEIIAGNPNFTKIDEALYIAGKSSIELANNRGKQSPSMYVSYDGTKKRTLTSEEFREMGRDYLTQLVNDYPNSSFRKQASDELSLIGGPKPKQ